ncbi:unnamed protein product [Soboliphyme baturini]|uniref:F-box domain-containing protein n=1 Tax=Soboliphyme baturini TaxID=241478 RepID=A0A183J9S8_9BILA|nr:unnamed protein product [Soboliphyme baturini]
MEDPAGNCPSDDGGTDHQLTCHLHCDHCFKGSRCDLGAAGAIGKTKVICAVIHCPNACGCSFHQCRLNEHLLLCSLAKVRCVNSIYGCPWWLLRGQRGTHLTKCPASVVYCSLQRSRELLDKNVKSFTTSDNVGSVSLTETTPIDVALALDDQRKILDLLKVKKSIRKKYCNRFNLFYPIIPLNDASPNDGEENAGEEEDVEEEEEEDQRSKACPVSRECFQCRMDPSSQHLHTVGSMDTTPTSSDRNYRLVKTENPVPLPKFYQGLGLHVGLSSEFFSSYMPKPRNYFTIMCDCKMRRDEVGLHYQNVHLNVVNSLDGWIVARCPNFLLGCKVFALRLSLSSSPTNLHDVISFDAATGTFPIRTISDDDGPPFECLDLLSLPDVALIRVFDFLDSFGLFCVSQTCRRLRKLCHTILPKRGLVEVLWVKQTNNGVVHWKPSKKKWFFSREIVNHSSWTVQPVDRILNHLRQCPFTELVEHPSKVPVLRFSKHKSSVSL